MSTQIYYTVFIILFIAVLIFSIIEIVKSPYSMPRKLMWLFICLLMPFFGSIVFHWYRKG
ncbi:hypothetical protein Q73A0000_04630 [Kaistella flava (ex Peng et al. 2021)]|uniref:Cardiolipin synthase N-terminal domain-containing protein n=1 Tax=Kaistella flava (ex Peng et al. 2021) TaxID=2038776 RepID=A0A7M2Y6J1_9FLAO|nr:hypothetical protein Q73A0000_04630 [Kaistella flava (ex Peng et al. 2021)]